MIEHILSKYSKKGESIRKKADKDALVKAIYKTSTIKKDVLDESLDMGNTLETRTKEDSDPDEFVVAGPTRNTYTSENSDPDEFLADNTGMHFTENFDEILLI